MRKRYNVVLFLALIGFCFDVVELYAGPGATYDSAIRHIKKKQPDFALMNFRSIVRDFPTSPLAKISRFAIAEYYYDQKMYAEAVRDFTGYIKDYPDSKSNVFAKAYLLKIIEEIDRPEPEEKKLFDDIEKEFFSKPLFLLFREYKETSYRSPSRNKFTIRYYIDNIEVYRNGSLFVKITQ